MKHNVLVDFLKGVAIIAVILYHLGVSKYGYLGVDLFLVISGFLITPGIVNKFSNQKFSYWEYLNKRLSRLWPGLVVISAISVAIGWFYMLPLHFKLDCESAVANCFFLNNLVQYITSGDYWSSDNNFKPLMHTWYVGILMQYYLVFPLFFWVGKKFASNLVRGAFSVLATASVLSLLAYLSPMMTLMQNFYLLPGRFFELGFGALLGIAVSDKDFFVKYFKPFVLCMLMLVGGLLMFALDLDSIKLRLVLVVAVSLLMVWMSMSFGLSTRISKILYPICFLGTASYSLYLTHQVIFAFYRYVVNSVFSLQTYIGILIATIIVGVVFYFIFERPLADYLKKKRGNMYKVNLLCLVAAIAISAFAGYCYKQNGLVRDIPELDLYVGQNNQTPEEYNQAPFNLNKDFENNGKKNVFVLGDSFGRDWINILQAAGVDSVMNLSYSMYVDEKTKERIAQADFVFVATNLPFFESYNYNEVYPELFNRKFWRVGLKSFGDSHMGNIYIQGINTITSHLKLKKVHTLLILMNQKRDYLKVISSI